MKQTSEMTTINMKCKALLFPTYQPGNVRQTFIQQIRPPNRHCQQRQSATSFHIPISFEYKIKAYHEHTSLVLQTVSDSLSYLSLLSTSRLLTLRSCVCVAYCLLSSQDEKIRIQEGNEMKHRIVSSTTCTFSPFIFLWT